MMLDWRASSKDMPPVTAAISEAMMLADSSFLFANALPILLASNLVDTVYRGLFYNKLMANFAITYV